MKSFMEWFKASTKIKRWLLLILVGVVLVCYGMMRIFTSETLNPLDLINIVLIFVMGFALVVISVVFIQKRTLEIYIEANNADEQGKQAKLNIKSLIFNKKVYEEGPKIVAIGGGKGLNTVIEGFKKYTNNITAIVTMSDYGNVPTNSRRDLNTLPLKDIKDSIIAMSDKEELMEKLLNLNFSNERLRGLNFGDIYLTGMNEICGNISEAIAKSTEVLNINGRVIPVTLDEITICAELADGTTIKQKDKIPEIVAQRNAKINRIYISPSNCRPAPGVIEAIEDADVIIIGPGSLYTNVLPNLLVKNVAKAIKDSKAMKFYISNIMTEPGQTDNYALSEHLRAIKEHVGLDVINYCLADTGEIVPEFIRKYNKEGSDIVEIDSRRLSDYGIKVIQRNMSCIKGEKIRHNPEIIAATIIEMICNDLKYHDMQNDTEYVLLQSVLKEQRKVIARNEKSLTKVKKFNFLPNMPKKQEPNKASKFSEKYKERVKSIQNTDAKISENKKIAQEIEKMKDAKKLDGNGISPNYSKNDIDKIESREPIRRSQSRRNK